MRRANLLGQRFGRLVVVSLEGPVTTPGGTTRLTWRCECDCGKQHVARGNDLRNERIRSCGCLRNQTTSQRMMTHGQTVGRQTKEYRAWAAAKKRCTNPKETGYHNYGGRGIQMCESWLNSFEAFYADMGRSPKGSEIDRVNVDGHYEPGNCRWVSRAANRSGNQRRSRYVEFEGERMTVAEASRRAGISQFVVYGRLDLGWPVERALREPVGPSSCKQR